MSPSVQSIASGCEVVFAFLRLEQVADFADLFQRAWQVLAAAFRISVFSFENAISIGLRSGE